MPYKLIALDLDGTILKKNNCISKKDFKTIEWLLKNNIKIIISTGRSINSIEKIIKKLNIINYNLPVIAYNGAAIYDFKKKKIIKKNIFNKNEVINIFNDSKKYKVKLWAYSVKYNNLAYVNTFKSILFKFISLYNKHNKIMFTNNNIIKFNDQCYKFIISGKKIEIEKFKNEIISKYNFNIFNLFYFSNKFFNFEISPINTDKKNALEYLSNIYYKIKKEEIIAIGDGNNDIEMIKWAGLGIAMGNASDEVKKYSDFITDNYKRSGFSKAIKKFIINK